MSTLTYFGDVGESNFSGVECVRMCEWEYVLVEVGDDEFEEISIERSDVSGDPPVP
tara:strand:- start:127 stop:294 length:168 start_codon:yes stop_codon:yes gene_type:complete